jgi:hypothetical protein
MEKKIARIDMMLPKAHSEDGLSRNMGSYQPRQQGMPFAFFLLKAMEFRFY